MAIFGKHRRDDGSYVPQHGQSETSTPTWDCRAMGHIWGSWSGAVRRCGSCGATETR